MGTIYDALVSWFAEDEWPITPLERGDVLRTGFNGRHGRFRCYAQARETHHQFVFYSVAEITVPEPLRGAMAEFLTLANYGLIIGNFEMDFDDGEIRYKTSVDVEFDRIAPGLIKACVLPNVMTMDRYLPGIMAVASGAAEPGVAIGMVEGS